MTDNTKTEDKKERQQWKIDGDNFTKVKAAVDARDATLKECDAQASVYARELAAKAQAAHDTLRKTVYDVLGKNYEDAETENLDLDIGGQEFGIYIVRESEGCNHNKGLKALLGALEKAGIVEKAA
jgi:hypothetical protein